MLQVDTIGEQIFRNLTVEEFNDQALQIFRYQYKMNAIYRKFVDALNIRPDKIHKAEDIPFIPIQFFRDQLLVSGDAIPKLFFESSGTTGSKPSRHFIADPAIYSQSFNMGFEHFFGQLKDYCFLALLPSYLEQQHSSLVYMMSHFIDETKDNGSGFFLHDSEALLERIKTLKENHKVILWGVSYALLDLAEQYRPDLSGIIVLETGGMKGRRKELVKEDLHQKLSKVFNVPKIASEYGMTELLSQAYSRGDGIFHCPPWMKVLTRDTNDPLSHTKSGKSGGINIIDLANIHSCSFIATQDLGKVYDDGSFEVLGRFDESDIRGCNLMVGDL